MAGVEQSSKHCVEEQSSSPKTLEHRGSQQSQDLVDLSNVSASKPSRLTTDQLMATYPQFDRYQIELVQQYHELMTKHFGTEDYDPEEALKLRFKQPEQFSVPTPQVECIAPLVLPEQEEEEEEEESEEEGEEESDSEEEEDVDLHLD